MADHLEVNLIEAFVLGGIHAIPYMVDLNGAMFCHFEKATLEEDKRSRQSWLVKFDSAKVFYQAALLFTLVLLNINLNLLTPAVDHSLCPPLQVEFPMGKWSPTGQKSLLTLGNFLGAAKAVHIGNCNGLWRFIGSFKEPSRVENF